MLKSLAIFVLLLLHYNCPSLGQRWTKSDCECQCSSLKDEKNHGDCNIPDSSAGGQRWCYLPGNSQCKDLQVSDSGRFYSYHACTTPTRNSLQCKRALRNDGKLSANKFV